MKKIICHALLLTVVALVTRTTCAQVLPDKTIEETAKAIVKIRMQKKTGEKQVYTGFFVDENGTCMTDLVNLQDALWGTVITQDGSQYEIDRIVAVNEDHSVAKFTLKNTGGKKFPFLKQAADPRSGYRYATFIQVSHENPPVYHEGIIHRRYMKRTNYEREVMHISALPYKNEYSIWGVPILNTKGELTGMMSYWENNTDFMADYIPQPDQWEKTDRTIASLNKNKIVPLFRSPELEPNLIYYAIELARDATYVYAGYTHTFFHYGENFYLWNERDRQQFGFYIKDLKTERMFYLKESTLGSAVSQTRIELCKTHYFRMTFPALPPEVEQIALVEGSLQEWTLPQINLQAAPAANLYNIAEKEYALRTYLGLLGEGKSEYYMQKYMQAVDNYHSGSKEMAMNGKALVRIFNREPIDDIINMLADYAQSAKVTNLTWMNLFSLYAWQEEDDRALATITRAIETTQGARLQELYAKRADLYETLKQYDAAYKDWDAASKVFYVASQYKPWMFTGYKMICAYEAGKTNLAKTHYWELHKQLNEASLLEPSDGTEQWQGILSDYAEKLGISN